MSARLLLTLAAYAAGAIPSSLWIGRIWYRVDLRAEGSGNLGATNTYRVLGWKAAVPVVLVDTLKGWVPVAIFPLIVGGTGPEWRLAYGAAAIIGHVFSFWAGFRGGKGVATSAGVFLALAPLGTAIALGVWLLAVLATGFVSLGSISAAIALPLTLLMVPHGGGPLLPAFTTILALFILWAHRSNVARLLRGQEHRFGRRRTGQ